MHSYFLSLKCKHSWDKSGLSDFHSQYLRINSGSLRYKRYSSKFHQVVEVAFLQKMHLFFLPPLAPFPLSLLYPILKQKNWVQWLKKRNNLIAKSVYTSLDLFFKLLNSRSESMLIKITETHKYFYIYVYFPKSCFVLSMQGRGDFPYLSLA